jgi:hypothetical protein
VSTHAGTDLFSQNLLTKLIIFVSLTLVLAYLLVQVHILLRAYSLVPAHLFVQYKAHTETTTIGNLFIFGQTRNELDSNTRAKIIVDAHAGVEFGVIPSLLSIKDARVIPASGRGD